MDSPRVLVIGTSGSGKTTVARQLARLFGVPHVELDAYMHQPNWTPSPLGIFREQVSAALSSPGWVADGNYHQLRDITWGRANTVVWLDPPLVVSVWRLIPRTFGRMMKRTELWNGNREDLRNFLDWNNVILWALKSHSRRRREYEVLLSSPEFAHLEVIRLRSSRQVKDWLGSVAEGRSTTSAHPNPWDNPSP